MPRTLRFRQTTTETIEIVYRFDLVLDANTSSARGTLTLGVNADRADLVADPTFVNMAATPMPTSSPPSPESYENPMIYSNKPSDAVIPAEPVTAEELAEENRLKVKELFEELRREGKKHDPNFEPTWQEGDPPNMTDAEKNKKTWYDVVRGSHGRDATKLYLYPWL